jgi:hypothetical protein
VRLSRGLIVGPAAASGRIYTPPQRVGNAHYQADDDLVFCHPETGKPYDRSKLLKRFKDALDDAGVRQVRSRDRD